MPKLDDLGDARILERWWIRRVQLVRQMIMMSEFAGDSIAMNAVRMVMRSRAADGPIREIFERRPRSWASGRRDWRVRQGLVDIPRHWIHVVTTYGITGVDWIRRSTGAIENLVIFLVPRVYEMLQLLHDVGLTVCCSAK